MMKKKLILLLAAVLMLLCSAASAESGEVSFPAVNELPAALMERVLTDAEIAAVEDADLDTLKDKISTFGDYVEWVRMKAQKLQFVVMTTSNPSGQVTFGAKFAFEWLHSWFSPNQTASIAQYVLEDNYPGIGVLVCGIKSGTQLNMKCAVCIPQDNVWYLLNAETFIDSVGSQLGMSCSFSCPLAIADPADIAKYYENSTSGENLIQAMMLTNADQAVLNPVDGMYEPQSTENITDVYVNEYARFPEASETLPFDTYGFPDRIKTDSVIDSETAIALSNKTPEEAAEAIHTLPDCMNYLFYSGFMVDNGDQQLSVRGGEWHYNYGARKVFGRRKGNCGGTSGLVAFLLQGDYDEVGMINMKFGNSEGHVINYIRDGEMYYVFDAVQWVGAGFQTWGLSFKYGNDLRETALQYGMSRDTRMMVAYTHAAGGDAPTLWDGSNICRFPNGYCDTVQILQETPEDGYAYNLFDADPDALKAIDLYREVW